MVEGIKKIRNEIELFDKYFSKALSSKANLLHKITKYIGKNPGKKIRPICVILSAGLLNNLNEKIYRGAVLIELLHTATLIHDDIVDDAQLRRSKFSINTIWKNKIGVLIGDYFLAQGLKLSVKYNDFDILELVSDVVQKIVEGELIQIQKTKRLNLTEKDYFEIISLKTGALFETSFQIGSLGLKINADEQIKIKKVGLNLGMLFQIKDDILDYTRKSIISGKSYGNDIKEGKINLPLLLALKEMTFKEKNFTYKVLRSKKTKNNDIVKVFSLIKKYNGLNNAELISNKFSEDAKKLLLTFPQNKFRDIIMSLIDYLNQRKK